ncbi:MAG TPA: ABC transporter permease, partial [Puia sp.]
MFTAYSKIAIRNLARHKTFLLINTIGLVVGIAVCLLILNYTIGERSVDKFHKHADFVYRIQDDHYASNGLSSSSVFSYPALGPAIKSEYPMVRDVVRMYPVDEAVMDYKGVQFKEEKIYFTEPSFFNVFSFPQIEGNPSSMLNTPNSIVLTRSVAKRYFGNESALGKIITMRIAVVRLSLLVTGIMDDPPKNSHLQFSSLISYSTMHELAGPDLPETSWSWAQIITYILLAPGTDPKVLELQLPGFMDRHTGKTLVASHEKDVLSLQPLKDIYLHAAVGCEFDHHGSPLAVYSLSVIAVFILMIAWINYINLTTARGIYRAKEVGVKKVLGASRIQLIYQFLLESAVLNFMAIVLGIGVYALTLPFFNNIMGHIGYPEINIWLTYSFWIALISILILGSLISGLYPAFVLSSFNPSRVFKSKSANPRKFNLRQALVVFQFGISVGLVTATFIVFRQINFMRNKNLGINLSNTIVINPPIVKDVDSIRQRQVSILIDELNKIPLVEKVSFAASIPGEPLGVFSGVIRQVGSSLSDAQSFKINMVDEQYFELFGNTFVAGRNFNKDFGTDKNAVVINEAASALLGFRTPNLAINKEIF